MREVTNLLRGGDRRSIGRSNEAARMAITDKRAFDALARGMSDVDALVRMRSADALEKASRARPDWLQPHKVSLIRLMHTTEQPSVRKSSSRFRDFWRAAAALCKCVRSRRWPTCQSVMPRLSVACRGC